MHTSLTNDAVAALVRKLDQMADANALMYGDLDTVEQAKDIIIALGQINERYKSALEYIQMHNDDFESEAAMTGHEQVIFRFVAQVLGSNA